MKKCYLLLTILMLYSVGNAQESAPVEGWPRVYESQGNKFIVYQPQIQSWEDHKIMKAVSAVQVDLKSQKDDVFGAIYIQADTETNLEMRMVVFTNIKITDIRFPNVEADTVKLCNELIRKTISPKTSIPIALDRVIAAIERSELQQRKVEVNLEPPPIYYSSEPAILIIFIGAPKFEPVKNTDLIFAANTNWDLFLDTSSKNYYLLNGDSWLMTKDVLKGPWASASKLPQSLYKLPDDKNWENVRKNLSIKSSQSIPSVFVSTTPAELIVTDGPSSMTMIQDTSLFYITNTDSHLFFYLGNQHYYFLTAGRWFKTKDMASKKWSSASKDLPAEFGKIPDDHVKSSVLASVPGSEEANAAVLLASIPQKAKVDRKNATVTVVYEGKPEFIVIQDTTVRYAVNTPYSVFLVNNRYYCCHQGVWFESSAAAGPWAVCSVVPKAIYTIPPTHPKHNVTYVYIYDSSPDVVYVGYTSGYSGSYVAATGALMFGLGYMIGHDDDHWDYHHYHYGSHYYSYGCGAHYDYYHGGYYRSAPNYGPYGGAGRGAAYNPATGTYARGAYRYGPSGGAFAAQAYNPSTGRYAAKAGAKTPYGSWGRTVVADGDKWAQAGHRSNWKGTVAGARTSEGGALVAGKSKLTGETGAIGKSKYGDLYAGKDGNVYKRTDKGSWQKNVGGSWQNVEPSRPERTTDSLRSRTRTPDRSKVQPTDRRRTERTRRDSPSRRSDLRRQPSRPSRGTYDQLNRERRSRQTGNNRTRNYQQSRSRGSRSGGRSGGSRSRSTGGGRRGGGGGRRR